MKILKENKYIELNKGQQLAIKSIEQWWRYGDFPFMCLAGYSGTGKSTIIKYFLDEIVSKPLLKYQAIAVTVTAPTHKARQVISDMTGVKGATIQALLGLRPSSNVTEYDPNSVKFEQTQPAELRMYDLIVVDEASMINAEMFNLIHKTIAARRFGSKKTKVLFVGDPAQLPPVNESISICFTNKELTKHIQLTEVMRQESGNPLLGIYSDIRDNLTKPDPFKVESKISQDRQLGIEVVDSKNKDKVESVIKQMFKDYPLSKVICWTNNSVNCYNKAIRNKIMFTKTNNLITEGDLLMSYKTIEYQISAPRRKVAKVIKNSNILYNSCEYMVIDCVKGLHHGIGCYKVGLEDLNTGEKIKTVFILDHLDPIAVTKYDDALEVIKQQAINASGRTKTGYWREFYSLQEKILSMVNTKNSVKAIDYAYALTVHKSQGSTYEQVFVDFNDISKNKDIEEKNKLLYVALSRPKFKVYLSCSQN